jgi:hypothetical protein
MISLRISSRASSPRASAFPVQALDGFLARGGDAGRAGPAWREAKLRRPLLVHLNGQPSAGPMPAPT